MLGGGKNKHLRNLKEKIFDISPVLVSWRPKYLFSLGKLLSFVLMVKVHNENSPCLYLYQSIAHRPKKPKAGVHCKCEKVKHSVGG